MRSGGIYFAHATEGTAYDPDRERVRELRMQGKEITEIMADTGLPDTQITDYCRELGLPISGSCQLVIASNANTHAPICPVCGHPICQGMMGRQRKYCSDYCKNRAGYLHRKRSCQNGCVCATCGRIFYPAVQNAASPRKYCSRECYFEKRYGCYWCKPDTEHMSSEEECP